MPEKSGTTVDASSIAKQLVTSLGEADVVQIARECRWLHRLRDITPLALVSRLLFDAWCEQGDVARRHSSHVQRVHWSAHFGHRGIDPTTSLCRRERETLEWLLTGASEKEIAAQLGIGVHTVHQYVKTVYRRFGVSSRAQLMARQLRAS